MEGLVFPGLPDATFDTVELDPGVIDVAKKYFGIRETALRRMAWRPSISCPAPNYTTAMFAH
jgi:hypothetical protein